MKKLISAALVTVTIFTVSCNNNDTNTTAERKDTMAVADNTAMKPDTAMTTAPAAGKDDAEFAKAAADGGMTEVMASKTALTNGTAAVKDLANMMIKDHTKGGDELKGLAAKSNIMLPSDLSPAHKQKLDGLMAMKGADFDKAYLDMMEADHKETISMFQTEAGSGMNPDLKSWAAGKVSVFQGHLQMTMDTKGKMK